MHIFISYTDKALSDPKIKITCSTDLYSKGMSQTTRQPMQAENLAP